MRTQANGNERIILGELNERQKAVLTDAVNRVHASRRQAQETYAEYQRLVAMAMPEGANGLDLERGVFYYEKPSLPVPPALGDDEAEASD